MKEAKQVGSVVGRVPRTVRLNDDAYGARSQNGEAAAMVVCIALEVSVIHRNQFPIPRIGGARNERMASSVMPGKMRMTPTCGSSVD